MATARTLSLREQAHANVAENAWLARLVQEQLTLSARWVTWDESRLCTLVPRPEIRSWNYANTFGCPLHGGSRSVYEYSLDHPGQVRCRIGGEAYPNADFRDPDGRGWLDQRPDSITHDQRYFFVADYYRFVWQELRQACSALAVDYLLTGNSQAARKAATILAAIGEVYPHTDNRCTESWAPAVWWVPISDHDMEGRFVRGFANAYLFIKDSGQVRAEEQQVIENGLMRHAAQVMRRIYQEHPLLQAVNMGASLLQGVACCARAAEDEELLHYAAAEMNLFLSNAVWEGGLWNDNSTGYHAAMVLAILFVAEALLPQVDLYRNPRLKQMVDFLFDVRSCITGGGLALGDAHNNTEFSAAFAPIARAEWKQNRYTLRDEATKSGSYLDSFTREAMGLYLTRPMHTVLGRGDVSPVGWRNYGSASFVSVLRERVAPTGWLEAMLFYGPSLPFTTHSQADKLSLALFGQGRAWLEEIGLTDGYMIPVYVGWSQHNISHATVTVDARKQEPIAGGRLHAAHLSERIKMVDASAEDAYPDRVSLYRRCLSLVRDPVDGSAYLLDLFRVRGGTCHEYSVHAGDTTFRSEGLALGEPQPGTLAGPDVPYGDPQGFDLSTDEDPIRIRGYRGSGYQFLARPAYAAGDAPWRAFWEQDDKGLLVTMPGGSGETVIVTDGQRYQLKENQVQDRFKYLLVRRAGEKELHSDFVAALEIYQGKPRVESVRRLAIAEGGETAVAAAVQRGNVEDWIVHNLQANSKVKAEGLVLRGRYGYMCRRGGEPEYLMVLGGTRLAYGGYVLETEGGYEGEVVRVEEKTHMIYLRGVTLPGGAALVGQKVIIERPEGGAVDYEIEAAEGARVQVKASSLVFNHGIVKVYDAERRIIYSDSLLSLLGAPGPQARGLTLTLAGQNKPLRIKPASGPYHHGDGKYTQAIELEDTPEQIPLPGTSFSIWQVGPGDRIFIPGVAALERVSAARYNLSANTALNLALPGPHGAHVWLRHVTGWLDCGLAQSARVTLGLLAGTAVELVVSTRNPAKLKEMEN